MKYISRKVLSSLAILSLIVSCGQDSGDSSSGTGGSEVARPLEEEYAPVDGSNIQGHYQAKFITLNPHVNGTIPGSANFLRKDDKLFAYVRLFAGGVKAWHMQHVYTGNRCPTMDDDTNGDGFIDINEAEAVLGKILIPLDADISSQMAGRRFFPLGDLSGYYHYERVTSFRRFLADLQAPDKDLDDDIVKLPPGEGLRLVGKTVLIQGVAESVEFPETVGTKGRYRPYQTFPIACGVFQKIEEEPGEPYTDNGAPDPVAEVEEGQDRPANDDIPDSGETTGGRTTGDNTNESDDGNGPMSDGNGNTRRGDSTTGSSTGPSTETTTGSSSGPTGSSTGGSAGRPTGTGSSDDEDSSRTGRSTSGRSGGRSSGSGSGNSTTGSSEGGTTTGESGGDSEDSDSRPSSGTTTTTTTGGSSSSSSTSTGTTGEFLDSSSGI